LEDDWNPDKAKAITKRVLRKEHVIIINSDKK